MRSLALPLAALAAALAGCSSSNSPAPAAKTTPAPTPPPQAQPTQAQLTPKPSQPALIPAPSQSIRLRGEAIATQEDEETWTSGTALINTPLPDGYAPPTPPGCIDIKAYPSLRRAQTTGTISPRIGMNMAFFPLFNHITRRDIPMTSPVEMDYQGWTRKDDQPLPKAKDSPDRWTMSFLYRTPDLGPAGDDAKDSRIIVIDTPERLVISLGFQGGYGMANLRTNLDTLAEWIAQDGRYEVIGEPRALNYNGPDQRDALKWGEVQLPVKPKAQTP